MSRRFHTLDVFTNERFSGNPLAVVHDSEGLDTDTMQAIAREFNLSETVFVFPPKDPANRAAIRIFTPTKELPFAGHPTVGTAVLLNQLDGNSSEVELVLEEQVGPVACKVNGNKAQFTLAKLPERTVVELDKDLMARVLGISPSDIGLEGHDYAVCDAGVPFPTLPLNNLKALQAIKLNAQLLTEHNVPRGIPDEIVVYTKEASSDDANFQVRMFAPSDGIPEDPATGSAAAGFAGQIVHCMKPQDGTHQFVLNQGVEMGRPSKIELQLTVEQGALVDAKIAGQAIIMSEGALLV